LVDDHDLVRTGFRRIVEDQPDMAVVGECASGEAALEIIRNGDVDLVLLDMNMPGMGGIETARRILGQDGDIKIIGVSVHVDGAYPQRVIELGGHGYLSKGCTEREFLSAIRTVRDGSKYIGQAAAQNIALNSLSDHTDPMTELSHRELSVVRLLAKGKSTNEIANSLHVSIKTVSTYRSRIHSKLGIRNDVELAHLAMRHGIVERGELE